MRVERIGPCTMYLDDCREVGPSLKTISVTVADPPYGETNLDWDKIVSGWAKLMPRNNLWCFGSMRFFMEQEFPTWKYAQEIIWEKHNGSNFHADRFRRVHEIAVHFYRGEWDRVYKQVQFTHDATARTVRKKPKPSHHLGSIGATVYESEDGGPRMMRSVIYEPSTHGHAIQTTQKPVGILYPIIQYSCPIDGTVFEPFMGSGSGAIASIDLGRKYVGCEINEERFEAAVDRVRKHLLQGVLL